MPADAVPGVGAGRITQEQGTNPNPWTTAQSCGAPAIPQGRGRGKALCFAVQRTCQNPVRKEQSVGQFPRCKTHP